MREAEEKQRPMERKEKKLTEVGLSLDDKGKSIGNTGGASFTVRLRGGEGGRGMVKKKGTK